MTATLGEPTAPDGYADVPCEVVRLKARRRAIARSMEVAGRIPCLTADMQIDLGALLEARTAYHDTASTGGRLSVMAFLARAAVDTLVEFPDFNATYTERALVRWMPVNLSVAVDSAGGLVVPVVRQAERLDVVELGARIAVLAQRARDGVLSLDDLAGGTFTLSNPGAVGPVLRAEALLNPPQVALLGLPAMKKIPVVVADADANDRVEIRTVVCPSLTFDHRVLDGAEAVRFLNALRRRVEGWSLADYLTPADSDARGDS